MPFQTFREKIFIGSMCIVMFILGSLNSCIQTVKEAVTPEPEKPVIVDPVPDVKPDPEPVPPKPEPKPEPKPSGKIVMYTSDGCVWCVRWEQNELQKVIDAGWDFEPIESATGPWPRFSVTANGKTIQHTGYMNMATLRGIVERLK